MKKVLMSLAIGSAFALAGLTPVASNVAAAPPTAPATQMMPSVLAKMEKAGKELQSLQAGIAQERIDRTLGVKEKSAGTLFYKAGAQGAERVLLEYTLPIPETVAVVGDKVTIYQPKINQVFLTTRKASANKNRSLNFLGLAYSDAATQMRERYNVTILGEDTINGQLATQIQLDPKDKSEGVQSLMIWVDHKTWLPVQYYVIEKNSKTTITLTAMKPNVKLADDKFQIAYPKTAKVVQG